MWVGDILKRIKGRSRMKMKKGFTDRQWFKEGHMTSFFSAEEMIGVSSGVSMDDIQVNNQAKLSLKQEDEIISHILRKTKLHNKNNLSRTAAYQQFYQEYPGIHWAFLAHMVSRNGGWNMTDLKGELVTGLLDEESKYHYFLLLERCNWLIFQDAYPQLLLYKMSKKYQINLFYLLPKLHISKFMQHIWNLYWTHESSALLTYALIINEQHYIQKRVVQNSWYKENVLHTIAFKAQGLSHFNLILLPYIDKKWQIKLAGTVMKDFMDIRERILVGIRLYHILFCIGAVKAGSHRWAQLHKHTASRADYWPDIFSGAASVGGLAYQQIQLKGRQLHKHIRGVYSPTLVGAWQEIKHAAPERRDWYTGVASLKFIGTLVDYFPYDMTNKYIFILNKMDLANVAKERLSSLYERFNV